MIYYEYWFVMQRSQFGTFPLCRSVFVPVEVVPGSGRGGSRFQSRWFQVPVEVVPGSSRGGSRLQSSWFQAPVEDILPRVLEMGLLGAGGLLQVDVVADSAVRKRSDVLGTLSDGYVAAMNLRLGRFGGVGGDLWLEGDGRRGPSVAERDTGDIRQRDPCRVRQRDTGRVRQRGERRRGSHRQQRAQGNQDLHDDAEVGVGAVGDR